MDKEEELWMTKYLRERETLQSEQAKRAREYEWEQARIAREHEERVKNGGLYGGRLFDAIEDK